jgi:hypothetical protein
MASTRRAVANFLCATREATRPHTQDPFTGTRLFQDPTGLPNIHATNKLCMFFLDRRRPHPHTGRMPRSGPEADSYMATWQQTTRIKEKTRRDSFLRAYHCLHTALHTRARPLPRAPLQPYSVLPTTIIAGYRVKNATHAVICRICPCAFGKKKWIIMSEPSENFERASHEELLSPIRTARPLSHCQHLTTRKPHSAHLHHHPRPCAHFFRTALKPLVNNNPRYQALRKPPGSTTPRSHSKFIIIKTTSFLAAPCVN